MLHKLRQFVWRHSRFISQLTLVALVVTSFIILLLRDSASILQNSTSIFWQPRIARNRREQIKYPIMNGTRCNQNNFTMAIVVFIEPESAESDQYGVAQHTLKCYAQRWSYPIIEVKRADSNMYNTSRCAHVKNLYLHKHCAIASAMQRRSDIDWWMILDADTGVVYPDRCIEEYIDHSVHMIMYQRYFSWEVAAGNYIARNSDYARKFLFDWADYDSELIPDMVQSADQGAIHMHLAKTLAGESYTLIKCNRLWKKATNWEEYFTSVSCALGVIGSNFYWEGRLRIMPRAHAWVIDRHIVDDLWCPRMFMFHGWKTTQIELDTFPLLRLPNDEECKPDHVWPYQPSNLVNCDVIKRVLRIVETEQQQKFLNGPKSRMPYLVDSDIGECWPDCGAT